MVVSARLNHRRRSQAFIRCLSGAEGNECIRRQQWWFRLRSTTAAVARRSFVA
ncbi:MAG: hypothetical protein LH478_12300 [Chitinophagaceae bacterium]|nr:hypothetical protein [Chitinophagaceae bacterium]